MEAKELRLGNWVRMSESSSMWNNKAKGKITQIGSMNSMYDYEHFEPISLTPEVLEKCGFLKDASGYIDAYTLGMIKITDAVDGFRFDYPLSKAMLYLHQLQNLFYALTGTELKYQP